MFYVMAHTKLPPPGYRAPVPSGRSDRLVFALAGGWGSGHKKKHLIAALAVLAIARHLQRRHAL